MLESLSQDDYVIIIDTVVFSRGGVLYGSMYSSVMGYFFFFFFQAEDGIRDLTVTGVQTCALPISEGQRRYVESLSAYARQFLERMDKPDVDEVRGIAPAIAIRQKNSTRNPRSTVSTQTEICDYLRLLYARVGTTICRVCGREVHRDSPESAADEILSELAEGTRFYVLFPASAGMSVPEAQPSGKITSVSGNGASNKTRRNG